MQDDERDALTTEHLTVISKHFISSTSEATSKQESQLGQTTMTDSKVTKDTLPKKSNTLRTIVIVLVVIITGGILIVNLNDSGNSYQEKILTVEEMELSQPTSFLSTDGNYRENFWGDKFKVNCTITNRRQ